MLGSTLVPGVLSLKFATYLQHTAWLPTDIKSKSFAALRWDERGRTFLVRALGTENPSEEGTR